MAKIKIGMASFAHMHAGSYAGSLMSIPEAEIIGIWDDDPKRGQEMSGRFKAPYEPDLDKFLQMGMDGVVVCTENAGHKKVTLAAAAAGKHVICEKPLAMSVADAQEMVDACQKAGVILATAFPCRFSPAMGRLREIVGAGKLGDLVGIAGTNQGSYPGGWFVKKELSGGGAVIDHTVHCTDLMRWLTGAEVKSVYAEISNGMRHEEFDDCGTLTLEFTNGMFATLDTSWSRPKSFPYWGNVTLQVTGTGGCANMDMFRQQYTVHNDEEMRTRYQDWGDNIDLLLMKGFLSAIKGEWPAALASGVDGMRAVEVALAAYQSYAAHRSIALPPK